MSTLDEEVRAIQRAEEFMLNLLGTGPHPYKRIGPEVRAVARLILRHYPTAIEVEMSWKREER